MSVGITDWKKKPYLWNLIIERMDSKKNFQPDYTHVLMVLNNQRPRYLPLYEHHIDPPFISRVHGEDLSPDGLNGGELEAYYRKEDGFMAMIDAVKAIRMDEKT